MVDMDLSNWSSHIMLLLLVLATTLSKANRPTGLVQEYDTWKTKYSLQKEVDLIKQKY